MKKLIYSTFIVASTFMLASCGQQKDSEDNQTGQQTAQQEADTETRPETRTETSATDTIRLEISGNDQMQFSKNELRVKAGQVVELTLKHAGQLPKESMGHNWVLLKQGADLEAFAMDAIQARDNNYIPQDREDDIIAHTEMIGGGETTTITFKAPDKGTYRFLCSFPGHYMAMNGDFIVE